MAVWFTSDLHFGHANIIRYCNRPFIDVDEMNDELVARWNAVVDSDDTVWVLGDVAMGKIHDTLPVVGRLHGHLHLVSGNHDRCWSGHGKAAHEWVHRYLSAGFAEIHQGAVHVNVGDDRVLACHFPYRGDSHDEDRFVEHRPRDHGEWLLHGHVHDRWRQHERQINVGADAWDCTPVAEDVLVELLRAGPQDLAPLPQTRRV